MKDLLKKQPGSVGVRLALDSETEDGKAVLLTRSTSDGLRSYLSFPTSFRQIIEWLCAWGEKYVAFNMDYDARALLRFTPKEFLLRLYRDESAMWGPWKIYYRRKKEFTVKGPDGLNFALYDIWSHFQQSLEVAAEKTLGERGKDEIPESWYKRMGSVLRAPRTRAKVISYGLKDAQTASRLWGAIDSQCRALGVPEKFLERPLSPGSIAAGFFGEKLKSPVPEEGNWVARRAYAGGRIEVFKRGFFPRVYVYDIKSAYPWALSTLPDPRNSRLVRDKGLREDALYSVFRVRLSIPESCSVPPFPYWDPEAKSDLRIYPAGHFVSWLTGPEFALAMKLDYVQEIHDAVHLCGVKKPWLTEIPGLFEQRKDPKFSQAIKLILNSTYGKIAQTDDRMGEAWKINDQTRSLGGKFIGHSQHLAGTSNFFVASYVTALTRLRLWTAANSVGFGSVAAFMTDGIISLSRFSPNLLKRAGSLGSWEEKIKCGKAVIVGSGVYSIFNPAQGPDHGWADTSRGYRKKGMIPLRRLLRSTRTRLPIWGRHAVTLGDAVTKRNAVMNEMIVTRKNLDINFDRKRHWPEPWGRASDVLRKRQDSQSRIYIDPRLR